MHKNEVVKRIKHAVEQYRRLERHHECAVARLSGFDDALRLLGARPIVDSPGGYSVDEIYALDKMADEIDAEFRRENQVAT